MGDPVVSFFIPGKPGSKQSFKFSQAGRRYQPRSVVDYQSLVSLSAREAMTALVTYPLDGPLRIRITARFFVRDSKKAGPRATRPDFDNIAKPILDGLTAAGVWHDDGQVASATVDKINVTGDDSPGVLVEIWRIPALLK